MHAGALTRRCFQRRDAFTRRCFGTQIPLDRDECARGNFYMQARLHTGAFTTQKYFYTQVFYTLIRLCNVFCIQVLSCRDSFTRKYFLRRHTLTHSDKCFYTNTFAQ